MTGFRDVASTCLSAMYLCKGAGLNQETNLKVSGVFALAALARQILLNSNFFDNTRGFLIPFAFAVAYRNAGHILGASDRVGNLAAGIKFVSSYWIQSFVKNQIGESSLKKWESEASALISGATLGVLARVAGYDNRVSLAVAALFSAAFRIESFSRSIIWKNCRVVGSYQLSPLGNLSLYASTAAVNFLAGVILRRYVI